MYLCLHSQTQIYERDGKHNTYLNQQNDISPFQIETASSNSSAVSKPYVGRKMKKEKKNAVYGPFQPSTTTVLSTITALLKEKKPSMKDVWNATTPFCTDPLLSATNPDLSKAHTKKPLPHS